MTEAAPQHAVAHLVDVARRAPRLALDQAQPGSLQWTRSS
jgi:hypothetical protein